MISAVQNRVPVVVPAVIEQPAADEHAPVRKLAHRKHCDPGKLLPARPGHTVKDAKPFRGENIHLHNIVRENSRNRLESPPAQMVGDDDGLPHGCYNTPQKGTTPPLELNTSGQATDSNFPRSYSHLCLGKSRRFHFGKSRSVISNGTAAKESCAAYQKQFDASAAFIASRTARPIIQFQFTPLPLTLSWPARRPAFRKMTCGVVRGRRSPDSFGPYKVITPRTNLPADRGRISKQLRADPAASSRLRGHAARSEISVIAKTLGASS
jgi:hypothetical protein